MYIEKNNRKNRNKKSTMINDSNSRAGHPLPFPKGQFRTMGCPMMESA